MAMQRKRRSQKNLDSRKVALVLAGLVGLFLILFFAQRIFQGNLVKQDGQIYDIFLGKKLTGVRKIWFSRYDFNSQTGAMQTGFQTVGKQNYYFSTQNGKATTGFHEIAGYYYLFASNGQEESAYKTYLALSKRKNLSSGNAVIEKVIKNGMQLVGKSPYDYGGGRDDADIKANKFDCSSFAAYMYRKSGKPLVYQIAASTTLLAETGTTESWNSKERGDLLLTPDGDSEDEEHVAIYLGDGFILHDSASTGGVNISRLNQIIDPSVLGNMTWNELFETGTVQREI